MVGFHFGNLLCKNAVPVLVRTFFFSFTLISMVEGFVNTFPSFYFSQNHVSRISFVHRARRTSNCALWRADFRVYFDIEVANQPAGRMVFSVSDGPLPRIAENFRQLVTGERRSVDPALAYEGCFFLDGPTYVAGGGNYKWGHVCRGRGRNIFGRDRLTEPAALTSCRHPCPGPGGGSYYGLRVDLDGEPDRAGEQLIELRLERPLGLILEEEGGRSGVRVAAVTPGGSADRCGQVLPGDSVVAVGANDCSGESLDAVLAAVSGSPPGPVALRLRRYAAIAEGSGTVLAVPVGGPGSGTSRFDIIRVGESPPAWRQRLLLNQVRQCWVMLRAASPHSAAWWQAVIGQMESGAPALRAIASGIGPARIVRCGVLPQQ